MPSMELLGEVFSTQDDSMDGVSKAAKEIGLARSLVSFATDVGEIPVLVYEKQANGQVRI